MDKEEKKGDGRMAITPRGLKWLLIGLLVMVAGYILMTGGGSGDPAVFSSKMFDFRRLVAAPLVILCGIVIEVVAIMDTVRGQKGDDAK